VNVAVTVVFAVIVNVHCGEGLLLHAPPDHDVNVALLFGTAVSVIDVPLANEVPVGVCVIVPGPTTVVASVKFVLAANVAVAVVFAFTANVHTGFVLPTQTPAHEVNDAPVFGTAVNVTEVPGANEEPAGTCMIVPGPIAVVESVNAPLNFATAVRFAVPTVNVHTGFVLPLHGPDVQLPNPAPVPGSAVNVTLVPVLNHVPAGDCWIVPDPFTLVESVYFCAKFAVTAVFARIVKLQIAFGLFAHGPAVQPVKTASTAGTACK
jgi:hypothetical protein